MNYGRILVGGLAAGLVLNAIEFVMNTFVLADAMAPVYEQMGVPEPAGGTVMLFVGFAFLLGLVLAWLYAAVRPRLGAGPATAAKIAGVFWIGAVAFPVTGWYAMGVMPAGLALIAMGYGLVEFVLAALVAGALYHEGEKVAM